MKLHVNVKIRITPDGTMELVTTGKTTESNPESDNEWDELHEHDKIEIR